MLIYYCVEFEQEEDPSARSFFSEIISSISDVRFSHDGRYILSRDYLTVKIWDVNMERQPVKTIPIHEHLRPRLCDTYENDSIFDKFEVVFSGDAKNVMTGSYNNNFMIYPSDPDKEVEVVLQADKSAFKAKKVGVPTPINSSTSPTATNGKKGSSRAGSPAAGASGQGGRMRKETDADQIDFNKKILHMSWHPFEDSIAIAATNNVGSIPLIHAERLADQAPSSLFSQHCRQYHWERLLGQNKLAFDCVAANKPSTISSIWVFFALVMRNACGVSLGSEIIMIGERKMGRQLSKWQFA
jgi:WD40 repeat protein